MLDETVPLCSGKAVDVLVEFVVEGNMCNSIQEAWFRQRIKKTSLKLGFEISDNRPSLIRGPAIGREQTARYTYVVHVQISMILVTGS